MDDILNEINDENLQKNFANENSENNYSNNNNNNYQNNEQHIRNYNVRYNAVKILNRYERSDSYVDKLLDFAFVNNDFNKFDKALLTEIVNGVIRWRAKLDWILTGFYNGDYLKCLNWVKNAMRVGLYQLLFLTKIPPAIAIYETVEMTKKIQGEKTAGLVNAVLRNILRNIENIRYPEKDDDPPYYLATLYSYPKWLAKHWIELFGFDEAEKMMIAMNKRPYIPARVNRLKSSIEEIKAFLDENQMIYKQYSYSENTFMIFNPKINIFESDLFKEGKIAIQDPSATLAVRLANPQQDWEVADICSAPGGKAFLMAEMMKNTGSIIAIDKYDSKLRFIQEGAARLGLTNISVQAGDAIRLQLQNQKDLVFADVPCSGLGTISKKPDIKWKREIEDIKNLSQVQKKIIENAARLVKPGGVLLYSTCTIEPDENENIVKEFLSHHSEFELDSAEKYLPEKVCKNGMMQTFPHRHSCDGAFAARLVKRSK
ncbi:MAG TPA: 16S rRNA (cytosine(967)-C(5))-methyltransferase RsmB [Candidatus Kapabacteria bacterium]|nr:16S rRNA (cytosine(967)-C(5))-methyltransferase RsmB [Candidatus Kapabacteria bacterium]HOV92428.1 16S rRNA (cytosine(967)-C(5))-methyltransferase RsmB [Candidatus Kapabacteria bacterium]